MYVKGWAGFFVCLLAGMVLTLPAGPAHASAPDPTFGERNGATLRFGPASTRQVRTVGLVRVPDGSLRVFAEVAGDLGVFAYRRDGSLVRNFRGRGFALSDPWPEGGVERDDPRSVARHGRGATIVAGGVASRHQTITRVLDSGRADRRFGYRGTVRVRKLPTAKGVAVDSRSRFVTVAGTPVAGGGLFGARLRLPTVKVARYGRRGGLDRSFGSGGIFTYAPDRGAYATAVAVDPQNRILVAVEDIEGDRPRSSPRVTRLMRLTPDGRIDPSFGINGSAETPPGGQRITALAVLRDGSLIAGEYRLMRYLPNGMLDRSWGDSGLADIGPIGLRGWRSGVSHIVGLPGGLIAFSNEMRLGIVDGTGFALRLPLSELHRRGSGPLAVGPDGSLFTAPTDEATPLLNRIATDLTADPGVIANGRPQVKIRLPKNVWFHSLAVLRGGDLAAVGDVDSRGQYTRQRINRFSRDGRSRRGFGDSGFRQIDDPWTGGEVQVIRGSGRGVRLIGEGPRVKRPFSIEIGPRGGFTASRLADFPQQGVTAALALRDGRMLVAGVVRMPRRATGGGTPTRKGFRVARYRTDGSLDPAFGVRGIRNILFPIDAVPDSLALDSRGRILIAGGYCEFSLTCVGSGVTQKPSFARLLPDGRPDPSFGKRGRIQHRFGKRGTAGFITPLGDGRILAAVNGACGPNCNNTHAFMALRPDGSLDSGFGRDGRLVLKLGRSFWPVRAFPAGRSGVDLAATLEGCRADPQFAVLRLDRDGGLDRRFGGGDGILDFAPARSEESIAFDARRQGPSQIVFAGSAQVMGRYGNPEPAAAVARVRLDARDGKTAVRSCTGR